MYWKRHRSAAIIGPFGSLRPARTGGPVGGRGPAPLRFLTALLAVALSVLTGCSDSSNRLPDSDSMLWYEFEHAMPPSSPREAYYTPDLTGDGVDEMILFTRGASGELFFGMARIQEQQAFTLGQINTDAPDAEYCGVADVTGDGIPEFLYWELAPTDSIRLTVLEVNAHRDDVGRRIIGGVTWSASGCIMPDDSWGAGAVLLGVVDRDGDGTSESLVLAVSAGVKRRPRGVWLADWTTGEVLWRVDTAGTPSGGGDCLDLDGDGTFEIITAIQSPGNGVTAGVWSDDQAYVLVLDLDGNVVWWRQLAGYCARLRYVADDFDGDGVMEVVGILGGTSEALADDYAVTIMRGTDGAILARHALPEPAREVATLSAAGGKKIVVGTLSGSVIRFAFSGDSLAEELRIECGEPIDALTTLDLSLDSGLPAVALRTASGTIAVLDTDFSPLALWRSGSAAGYNTRPIVPTAFGIDSRIVNGMAVQTADRLYWLHLSKRRVPPVVATAGKWLSPLAVLAAAFAVVLVVPPWRRRTLATLRTRLTPEAEREQALDALLDELKTASHGKLAATGTFRRLYRQLAMLGGFDDESPEGFEERYRDAIRAAADVGVPAARSIARAAESLGLAPASVARLLRVSKSALSDLRALPKRPPIGPSATRASESVVHAAEPIDECLGDIKRAAQRSLSVLLFAELRRVAGALRDEIESADVELLIPAVSRFEDSRVLGTPREISFVLDNLLSNAVRAVAGRDERRIEMTIGEEDEHVVLRVRDTGRGIEPGMRERIFEEGVSEGGGGHGLPASRAILLRRGGSIELVESVPGEGATFEARFQKC